MEFQNDNGVAAETATATAKTNQKEGAQNGEAKPQQTEAVKPEPAAETAQQPVAQESKPALSLESKLKVVEELHRKTIQRGNLLARINQLENFEVDLATENDELENNPYQGCRLIIEDDKRRSFVTTTPGLIRLVAQFIFEACHTKLAEIEATINFPNV